MRVKHASWRLSLGFARRRQRLAGRRRDEHRAARTLSTRRKVRAGCRDAALRTAPAHSSRTESTTLCRPSARRSQVYGGWSSAGRAQRAATSQRAARRDGACWRAPFGTRCAFVPLFVGSGATSTRCRRRRATRGAIWSNFERTVHGFAFGGMDRWRRDPCVLCELRAWVCGACAGPAAVWSARGRERTRFPPSGGGGRSEIATLTCVPYV